MSKKKKVISQEDRDANWDHIIASLEELHRKRNSYVDAFTIAKNDYVNEGGSKMYFPTYLKDTYGIVLPDLSKISDPVLKYFPDFTIVDRAKFEFFALRYL